MKKAYKSKALVALHETASGLHRIGLVTDKTMRDFDATCLTSIKKLSPEEIAKVRKQAGVGQTA